MKSDQTNIQGREFNRQLEQSLSDPSVMIEIEDHMPQPQYGRWAHVAMLPGMGLCAADRKRQRERERSAQRRRQQSRNAGT
jgi:hypothetical protein